MTTQYTIEHLIIDFDDYKVKSNGVDVNIDLKAVKVLEILVNNTGKTVDVDSFMDQVWANKPSSPEVVTSAIARLRKLFKMTGVDGDLIVTVHKIGYRYEEPKSHPTKNISPSKYKLLAIILSALFLISLIVYIKHYIGSPAKLDLESSEITLLKSEKESKVTQIYILRHTEKSIKNPENPNLSDIGIRHAKYWKKTLKHIEFDRVFTTKFKRNKKTAEILSQELKIKPELYYPMSFEVLKFVEEIKGEKVLIIGHSNTIPDMVNRLIGETKYPPMSHKNYDQLYIIIINENGDASSSLLHIEQPEKF